MLPANPRSFSLWVTGLSPSCIRVPVFQHFWRTIFLADFLMNLFGDSRSKGWAWKKLCPLALHWISPKPHSQVSTLSRHNSYRGASMNGYQLSRCTFHKFLCPNRSFIQRLCLHNVCQNSYIPYLLQCSLAAKLFRMKLNLITMSGLNFFWDNKIYPTQICILYYESNFIQFIFVKLNELPLLGNKKFRMYHKIRK